jgi:hypothetical protein
LHILTVSDQNLIQENMNEKHGSVSN